jgi:hypothetical protein
VAFDAVNVTVSGDREAGSSLRADIQNIIEGQRQWYAFAYPGWWWAVLWTAIWLVVGFAILFSFEKAGLWSGKDMGVWPPLLVVMILACGGLWLMTRMFPKAVFEIGFSNRRAASARVWRSIVGTVIILGTIVAVVGGLIVERIKAP